MFNPSNAEAEGIREKKQQTCDPCLKTLLLFPIIPAFPSSHTAGKEHAADSLEGDAEEYFSLNERINSGFYPLLSFDLHRQELQDI